ncbi:DUF4013 domain-containing protein [Methanothermococcus sp. SCGC AD-155-C09]|nr:DUF4013 domain-containing protein [Methanothermococcus sp. SCGC AD-155-C09]
MSFLEKYLKEPFKYATSDWIKVSIGISLLFFIMLISLALALLLGPFAAIFTFIPVLIVSILLTGYYIGVIKNTLNGIDSLPNWSNFMEFIKDGILYYIAVTILSLVVYLPLILLIIVGIFFTGGFENYLTSGDLSSIITTPLIIFAMLSILYILIVSIVLMIYIPLATVNFAKKGFFGFFEFFDILKKVSIRYILILILYFVIYIIVDIILGIISIIPIIGVFTYVIGMGALSFLWGVAAYRAIAKYYLDK